jgi:hypothetical protein
MKLQILPLALREWAEVHSGIAVNPHALEGHWIGDRRHDELSRVLEGEKAL